MNGKKIDKVPLIVSVPPVLTNVGKAYESIKNDAIPRLTLNGTASTMVEASAAEDIAENFTARFNDIKVEIKDTTRFKDTKILTLSRI